MQDYLHGLNAQQREAVIHRDGPLMIVAGAGSGKTKVLTTRIAHLMATGVDAFNILALTFTNKAAKEMKERIEKVLGNNDARNLYIGTFHSVFARILRGEAHNIGYPNNFTIYDTDDTKSVIKTVVNELNLDDKHYKPAAVYNRISGAKNALVGPAEYANDYALQQEDMRANRPAIAQIYDAYVKRCFKNGAMDFDDLLLKFYELLRNVPESLSKYQRKFKYILVDEYQDTNPAQYEVIKLLGAMHENVCVVGDDAQSIYSFRGATIENILQFQKDYEDAKVVKLEQNYRSSKSILDVANEVIKNNKGQIPKNLWTDKGEGEKIKLVRLMTDNDEGKFVADTIQEQKLRNHYNNRDFAILYRTNAQSRAFEESLRRMAIPYTMFGGVSFYSRKEIKDYVAYLRVIVNPRDEEALKRIINYPVRGIGKTTIDKTVLMANEHNISMWEVLERAKEAGFRAGTLEAIENFVVMIKSFASMLQNKNAYDVAVHVGKQTNFVKELFNDKSTEGVQRYENVQELLNSIKEWTESPDTEEGEVTDKGLGAYLQQITLLTDADEKDPNADTVKLMSIHAAKGLEFGCVFAAGLEEMLFPNAMAINTREELEEERRLFYVVITRAKERLWISYANTRYRFGNLVQNEPSRFLEELPEQYVDRSFAGGGVRNQINNRSAYDRMNGGGWGGGNSAKEAEKRYGAPPSKKASTTPGTPSYLAPKQQPKPVEHVPSPDFVASDISNLQVGQRVEHQKFGFGEVIKMEGSAHNPIATVKFDTNGEKKIMLNYARLRIL
ncbi:ATP-dependent DNA helicase [Niastella yeongjuensis]|uniref:DNA 3'-5' helicase n=1 Tax=Niastella yeongjuensis TaxID=354355 RepID=A0A1V9EW84_9BACT|nr:UvrD-helicase domain-containing protein [Niastella yeongjuensis]OQP50391.1 ATP-dependent DNA helicase [Niastella yeongjuensis]SEN36484.1 DNA helicase-2 / ATP-dependent DNA helicase PcrA [Niastella yeongjuensis]